MKKAIFIDRDGTLIAEPADEQIDSLEKLEFVPGAISGMKALTGIGFELVMVTNQDGLGTSSFPMEDFLPAHGKMLATFRGEGVEFDDIVIDRSFPEENLPTRKPGTALLGRYTSGEYDLAASFVIGDRESDMQLARNLGATGLRIGELTWDEVVRRIRGSVRRAHVCRKTRETDITVDVDLDDSSICSVDTGLKFFDHMLDQIGRHSGIGLKIVCRGDLEVDEHHTIEDTGIALGEALLSALGTKAGIERYGFALPMDESRAMVLLDLGGRSDLEWDVKFTREMVGDVPTEMIPHFFKSFACALKANIYVSARGENTHHIAESIFKALARSLRAAVRRDVFSCELPTSKGLL